MAVVVVEQDAGAESLAPAVKTRMEAFMAGGIELAGPARPWVIGWRR